MEIGFKSIVVVDRKRASGENYSLYRSISEREFVEGYYFAISIQLAYTAADELSCLRTEIENYFFFVHIFLKKLEIRSQKLA